jgi:replicative DNA helicase
MTQTEAEKLTIKAICGSYDEDRQATAALLDELKLSIEHFTKPETQALYAAIADAVRRHDAIDLVALSKQLRGRVPPAVVMDVAGSVEGFLNKGLLRSRVDALRDAARRRRIRETLQTVAGLLDGDTSTDALLGELERVTSELGATSTRGASALDGSLMGLIDRLEAVQAGRREATLETGIEALDYAIGGLQPTLTIVGALPGVGKSALFAAVARNLAARGLKVGVLSLEDEREWLTERLLAEAAGVPLFVLGNRPLTNAQMGRVNDSGAGVHEMLKNIYVDDSLAMSPAEVVASARAMVARGCRAVLVDHLGEIRLNRSERHDLDVQEALQDLRGIAKTYRVPVVVACHLRRREGLNIDSIPRLTDFAFSAAIERCARVALGLFRPKGDVPDEVVMGIEVLKQTKGPANFNFRLNVGRLSGTVVATPVSAAMRAEFGPWRDA